MTFANHSTVIYSCILCAPVRVNPNRILNPNQILNPNRIPYVSAWTHRRETADEKSACWRWSGSSSPILETYSALHVRSFLKHLFPMIYFLLFSNEKIIYYHKLVYCCKYLQRQFKMFFFLKIPGSKCFRAIRTCSILECLVLFLGNLKLLFEHRFFSLKSDIAHYFRQ